MRRLEVKRRGRSQTFRYELHGPGLEGYLLKAFAQGPVSMNCWSDILKPCAYLERQAESRRQFRYDRADGLNSDQKIMIGADNHTNEACFVFQRQRTAIGSERKGGWC
jgi:hypothetical protein